TAFRYAISQPRDFNVLLNTKAPILDQKNNILYFGTGQDQALAFEGLKEWRTLADSGQPLLALANGDLAVVRSRLSGSGYRICRGALRFDIAPTYSRTLRLLGQGRDGRLIFAHSRGITLISEQSPGDFKITQEY